MTDKITALAARMPEDIDAMIIKSTVNRLYLTGMKSSAGTLLITRDKAYFIIDFRYIELAKRKVKNADVVLQANIYDQLSDLTAKHNIKRIGIESGYLNVADYLMLVSKLPNAEIVLDNSCNDIIIDMRKCKDSGELDTMQRAQNISDKVFEGLLSFIRPGLTEKEIALEIYRQGIILGADGLSFSTIAVSGINSSMPHGVPSDKEIKKGELLTLDFGYLLDGYCSDMTRTVAIGKVGEQEKQVYNTVLKAQLAALDAIAPGKVTGDIDKAARDIIYSAGYEGRFGHGLGHSLGVEVHETPSFREGDIALTQPGNVMSVEPGIYLEGSFGCRIEDVVYITNDGYINLTHSPKELIEL